MLINWCSSLQSAISDSEVEHITIEGPVKHNVPGHKSQVEFGYIYDISYNLLNSCKSSKYLDIL